MCSDGFRAESAGDTEKARRLYLEAWDLAIEDLDKCIAAHYVARVHADEKEKLRWNLESLTRTDLAKDESIAGFYPSMHSNLGFSYLATGDRAKAREQFELAQSKVGALDEGPYADEVRRAVLLGLESTAEE